MLHEHSRRQPKTFHAHGFTAQVEPPAIKSPNMARRILLRRDGQEVLVWWNSASSSGRYICGTHGRQRRPGCDCVHAAAHVLSMVLLRVPLRVPLRADPPAPATTTPHGRTVG